MSLLLVVRSVPGAELEGVVADDLRVEGDLRVFRRDGREVLRAAPEETLVVRDLARVRRPTEGGAGSTLPAW